MSAQGEYKRTKQLTSRFINIRRLKRCARGHQRRPHEHIRCGFGRDIWMEAYRLRVDETNTVPLSGLVVHSASRTEIGNERPGVSQIVTLL
jgi:hypothetical protein